jgi:threonine/homoserine/homoserine lactone efflux protein
LTFFVQGLGIGFAIAAAIGPIALLCIRRSLAEGRVIGLATGMGAATADAIYGAIAAFGLTSISDLLVRQKLWLGVGGGIFLCYLGLRTAFSKPPTDGVRKVSTGLWGAYFSTLLLTLTNPTTILSFVAVFTGFGLVAAANYQSAAAMVLGVFAGSAFWWLLLSHLAAFFRARITTKWMLTINRFSGAIVFAFGVYAFVTAVEG